MKDYREKQLNDFLDHGIRSNVIADIEELNFNDDIKLESRSMPSFDEWLELTQAQKDKIKYGSMTQSEKDKGAQ